MRLLVIKQSSKCAIHFSAEVFVLVLHTFSFISSHLGQLHTLKQPKRTMHGFLPAHVCGVKATLH